LSTWLLPVVVAAEAEKPDAVVVVLVGIELRQG
jgi:hypothetical protein